MFPKQLAIGVVALAFLGIAETASAYYAPQLGRFLTRDPAGSHNVTHVGMASMSASMLIGGRMLERDTPNYDPMAPYHDGMNLYQYVRSNPVSLFDPTGLASVDSGIKRCNGYRKGDPVFDKVSIHGFIGVGGTGIGFFEQDLNSVGQGAIRDDDFATYPEKDPSDVKCGDFYSICEPVMLDDECDDPQKFRDELDKCIADRTGNPGTYCVIGRNCHNFADGCIRKAKLASNKRNSYKCIMKWVEDSGLTQD